MSNPELLVCFIEPDSNTMHEHMARFPGEKKKAGNASERRRCSAQNLKTL